MSDHECVRCIQCDSCPVCAADALDREVVENDRLRLALAEATRERDEARGRLDCAEELAVAARVERDEARAERDQKADRLMGAEIALALSRARETEDGAVREAALHAIATLRGGASHLLAMSTGAHHCPGCGLIHAEWIAAAVKLESALSSPPRPALPADAATEAVREAAEIVCPETLSAERRCGTCPTCRCIAEVERLRTAIRAHEAEFERLPLRPDPCDYDLWAALSPAPAPSAKEGR